MIKVLIVDDSPVIRDFLTYILCADPEIYVVATASNGKEAVQKVAKYKPDVVLMDIHMPHMNGFDATSRIMETNAVPIIIMSGSFKVNDTYKTFKAIESGALVVVKKPLGDQSPEFESDVKELVKYVKLMSEIKVVKRWSHAKMEAPSRFVDQASAVHEADRISLVAIGASTGGPAIIAQILSGLPKAFKVPIVIVQHMSTGFIEGFVNWLTSTTGFPVKLASHGELLMPGQAYLAPDGHHIMIGPNKRIILSREEPYNGLRPTVAKLFKSVAEVYGSKAIGVLLTGMGNDGAYELKLMRQEGAITIAQDKESSIVFGMPREAIMMDAAEFVMNPNGIAELLIRMTRKNKG